ncbi:methylamine dehydrogenase light chain [Cupriavidus sp. TMH.W2]|uniref:methylamine dehydrogenase light chain n=1 Tax=Cupriavidus sp. TMH.W2 TaxID=3434465 RepID=UPI003D78935C
MKWMDAFFERSARNVAQHSGRRSALGKLGRLMVGAAAVPLLPVDRSARAATPASASAALPSGIDDQASCDYWKHCAIDGYLCACCGGSSNSCPPGTTTSPITWIGTCLNPHDGRNYIVSYNDCCGTTSCGHCLCNRNERERPLYKMSLNNDINWCMANKPSTYVCSVSYLLGVQEQ